MDKSQSSIDLKLKKNATVLNILKGSFNTSQDKSPDPSNFLDHKAKINLNLNPAKGKSRNYHQKSN